MIRQFELAAYRGAPNVPKVLYIPRHPGYATERTDESPECAERDLINLTSQDKPYSASLSHSLSVAACCPPRRRKHRSRRTKSPHSPSHWPSWPSPRSTRTSPSMCDRNPCAVGYCRLRNSEYCQISICLALRDSPGRHRCLHRCLPLSQLFDIDGVERCTTGRLVPAHRRKKATGGLQDFRCTG